MDGNPNKEKGKIVATGKVKWFNSDKGYGFIAQETGEDLFVHHSEVQSHTLQEGDDVEFDIGEGRKGPCATNVRSLQS